MTMPLDGFIVEPHDGASGIFGLYEAGAVIVPGRHASTPPAVTAIMMPAATQRSQPRDLLASTVAGAFTRCLAPRPRGIVSLMTSLTSPQAARQRPGLMAAVASAWQCPSW